MLVSSSRFVPADTWCCAVLLPDTVGDALCAVRKRSLARVNLVIGLLRCVNCVADYVFPRDVTRLTVSRRCLEQFRDISIYTVMMVGVDAANHGLRRWMVLTLLLNVGFIFNC